MDSAGARWAFPGAACCVLILTVVGSLYFQFSVFQQDWFQGSTLKPPGREAPKQPVGPPSRVILAVHPKTGSTTLGRAIYFHALAQGRQQTVSRVHYPYDRRWDKECNYVMQSLHNCTVANWCLIISTVRRSGANAVSQFFEFCRWVYNNNSTSAQKFLFAMNEEELKDAVINFTRRFYLPFSDCWWWKTYLAFRELGGFNFEIDDLMRKRISTVPNAVWIVLPPFEEGVQAREAALEPWFPGINLSENIMNTSNGSMHPWPVQYSKMMSYFRNESRWPTDLAEGLRHQDMMVLFYPDGRLF